MQFLWRAYKYIVTDFSVNSGVKYIKECIDTLEPYSSLFENHSTETSDVKSFNSVDMQKWKYEYYPYFSKSGLIPGGQFFGNLKENVNYGIGKDGAFSGEELCHFLYQIYKFADRVINKNIPTWKILFLLCKKTTYNNETISLSDRDISDMKNTMRRFQNFVFAFSGGNVAIEILEKDLDNPVPLHNDTPDNYYVDLMDLPKKDGLSYFINNTIDAGICYMSLGKFPAKWLGLNMLGYISLRDNKNYLSFINARSLENIPNEKYLEPSDIYPFPEEVVVHEFCHTLQYVLQDLFKLGTLVNPDDSSKYGYSNQTPNAPIGGFYNFYQDILAGKVKIKMAQKLV